MEQRLLFSLENYLDINPLHNYQLLFNNLPAIPITHLKSTGRKPIPRESLLKGLIFRNLKSIPSLTELNKEFLDNPSAALRCGFNLNSIPTVERFSSFLRDTPSTELVNIRNFLVEQLFSLGIIEGKYLSIDSCPVPAKVKENNLKTNVINRFNKMRIPKGDPDARLGVWVSFPHNGAKKIRFFWGYRNHIIIDSLTELPIWETTKTANVVDPVMFIPLFKAMGKKFNFPVKVVTADAFYDTATILRFILDKLKAKPRIPRNPRHSHNPITQAPRFSKSGNRLCQANLEMVNRGTFYDKIQNRQRRKWVCPLHHSKSYQFQFITCPIYHPKFFQQKGCYAYDRIDEDIRSRIDYGSNSFKEHAKLRSGVERVFSRLLDICMQNPTVNGLKSISNHCTIAHITVLLVAVTAAKNNVKDQIRFIKSFIPNFKPRVL